MRILHVINGLELGGAETLLYRLATRRNCDLRHEVICLGGRGWYSSLLEQHAVPVHHLRLGSGANPLRAISAFRKLVRQIKPDVVQSWLYVSNLLSGLVARPAGIPVVWGIHASTLEHVSRGSRIAAYVCGAACRYLTDYVINCSSRSSELHKKLGYQSAPSAVVHNGYDPASFLPDDEATAATRHSMGLARDVFVIGTIGRWHSQKDIPNLLEATRILKVKGINVKCILVGEGLQSTNIALAQAVRRTGCESAVMLLGPTSDVLKFARVMDLHVLASSGSEAFPNVVAETMLSGTPNVVTDVGDSALMVSNSGWVVKPRNPMLLAEAIEAAYDEWKAHGIAWERRRTLARQSIVDRFTFDRMASAYQTIWNRVLKERNYLLQAGAISQDISS